MSTGSGRGDCDCGCGCDLALTAGLAIVALAVLAAPLPHWLQAVLGLPLVLVLPGYALTAAIFPPGFITREERWVFTITFSIVAVTLGGLLLQVFIDLDRAVWIALLLALTLGLCAVSFVRRGRALPKRGGPIAFSRSLAVALLAAAAICAAAVAVASEGAGDQLARSHFSTIWLLPTDEDEEELEVSVENHEGRAARYTVRFGTLQRVEREWSFLLGSGTSWSRSVPTSRFGVASFAALYRGETLFRRVSYRPQLPR